VDLLLACSTEARVMKKVVLPVIVGVALGVTVLPAQALSWASVVTFISTMQTEMSAWAITVKQTALSANVVSQMDSDSKKQLANAAGAISMSDRVMREAVVGLLRSCGGPAGHHQVHRPGKRQAVCRGAVAA